MISKKSTGDSASQFIGRLAALLTILIWGTTFISTKVLLVDFEPVEILFFRFVIGFLALFLVCPHRLKAVSRRHEVFFALAGLCGICLYYLLENIALTYTGASNVGVIISVAPFFTAILSQLFVHDKAGNDVKPEGKLRANFFFGFAVAMAGVVMISFNGAKLELNPVGDILAVLAALVWACYSILTRKISTFDYPVILTTRRMFGYGIVFMIPALFLFDCKIGLERFANVTNLLNILYLGFGASALCFVTWNVAVKVLGAVKTSVYIYVVPVITVITSMLVLKEPVTWISAVGTVLAVAGLFLSEYSGDGKAKKEY
ncbi:MAG: DMT family transporter [Lachnospiraceae bacterium]|nr:DMT family transporter [Lachnospiraceae bacterium]